ncbi:MAG: hypothetical protein AAF539_02415 [Planctomycetota bacterium]
MLIALAWQSVFCLGFIDRWPRWDEAFCLAAAVWLTYVADRLLDARRLDITRPHSLRHRFHHDWAVMLTLAWMLVALLGSIVAVSSLPQSMLRTGMLVGASVLIYLAGVHFVMPPSLPKPVLVGCLFALGVSVVVWSIHVTASLVVGTSLAATIFSINCHLVAMGESHLDEAQMFPVATEVGWKTTGPCFGLCGVTLASAMMGYLPWIVALSIMASAICLAVANLWHYEPNTNENASWSPPSRRAIWVDFTTGLMPAIAGGCTLIEIG